MRALTLQQRPAHRRAGRSERSRARGLSVVEMMVGVAIGLIIVAAATLMVAGQLADNRRLLLETQLQQDLRAATDLVTREVRRAGYWKDVQRSTANPVLLPRTTNPYTGLEMVDGALVFSHADKDRTDDSQLTADENLGFRVNRNAIESLLGGTNWQQLTDPAVLKVTRFAVVIRVDPIALECALACSPGVTACPPVQQVRTVTIDIAGQAANEPAVQRALRTVVRVRNDAILGECRD